MPAWANQEKKPEVWLTIFVHGIMSIKPHVSFSNFLRFMTDDVHNTVYSKTVERMRNDPTFYQNQAMQGIGLKEIDPTNPSKENASNVIAMTFEYMSQFAHPDQLIENHYYTYGWTGLLSPQQRYIDAQKFYEELAQEVEHFRKQGIDPKIRIIGYSHGGNICLNLALVAREAQPTAPFSIAELILIGMPVQSETDYLVNDPIFEKIYHIYSRGDRIQKLDFFSFDRFFSRRIFKPRRDFILPDKLIQIQLKCTRNTTRTSHKKTVGAYNKFDSNALVGGKSRFLRNASPGHTELWFFGWTPANYRSNFPLNPLPVVSFIPIIIQSALDFEEKSLFEKPTLIDIRPEHELILIKNQKSHRVLTVKPFLTPEAFEKLKQDVISCTPENFTAEYYTSRIVDAYSKAKDEHHEVRLQKLKRKKKRTLMLHTIVDWEHEQIIID